MAVVTRETFEFALTNELRRAMRSQNFVTLVLIEPRNDAHADAVADIASLVNHELRETDLLATDAGTVWVVLLDADLQNSTQVIDRVMARLEHYQFTVPLDFEVGAACCPTHGADVETLRRVAAEARTRLTRRTTHGTADAQ